MARDIVQNVLMPVLLYMTRFAAATARLTATIARLQARAFQYHMMELVSVGAIK